MTVRANVDKLREVIGSFWTELFESREQLTAILDGVALVGQHLDSADQYADLAVGRRTIQPYRDVRDLPIRLRARELDTVTATVRRLDQAGTPLGTALGAANGTLYGFPLPPGLRDFATLTSRIENPAEVLFYGVDVWVDDHIKQLVFRTDPFATDAVAATPASEDREIVWWASGARLDARDVYATHGFAFGFEQTEDSVVQKAVLVPYADCIVQGGTDRGIRDLTAAATRVQPDAIGPLGTVEISDCRHGRPPAWLSALTIETGWLPPGLEPITIDNAELPVRTYAAEGRTRVDLGLRGDARSVRWFTDEVNRRCEARGTTLLATLGTWRGVSNPTAINPLEFMCSTVFRSALVIIRVDQPVNDAYGRHLSRLRQAAPPYLLLTIITTLRHTDAPLRLTAATLGTLLAQNAVSSGITCQAAIATPPRQTNCE